MTNIAQIAARLKEIEFKLFSMKFSNPNRKPLEDERRILQSKLQRAATGWR